MRPKVGKLLGELDSLIAKLKNSPSSDNNTEPTQTPLDKSPHIEYSDGNAA